MTVRMVVTRWAERCARDLVDAVDEAESIWDDLPDDRPCGLVDEIAS